MKDKFKIEGIFQKDKYGNKTGQIWQAFVDFTKGENTYTGESPYSNTGKAQFIDAILFAVNTHKKP